MKRNVLALILVIFAGFTVYGQTGQGQDGPIDLILLLDTSTNMSTSYDNVNNYITGGFLTEFLRVGDTFHLIAFSGTPRLDVARRIAATGDVETIIARMMLQYPIERGSNISGAITYAEQYIAGLPSRPKKIVLVSTGTSDTANLVSSANQRLSSRNATINFVQVTPGQAITNVPASGRPPAGPGGTPGGVSGGTPGAGQTGGAGHGQPDTGFADTGRPPVTDGVQDDGFRVSDDDTITSGGQGWDSTDGSTQTDDWTSGQGTGVTPSSLQESSGFSISSASLPWIIGLILLILLIIGLIMLFSSRRLGSSPNRVMAEVASSSSTMGRTPDRVDHSKDLARYAAGQNRRVTPYSDRPLKPGTAAPVVINPHGPLLLNLFVEDQNTAIGKRNIHSLKSGYSLSVGGGKGDGFLIFLVPLPANIGELRRNGSQLTFIPKKAKYFPDIGANEVRDCLNKTIRIISDKNYELRFRFEMYEDPLIALNRMLNSIKVPG